MTGELALLPRVQCQNNEPYSGEGEPIRWLFTGYAVLSGSYAKLRCLSLSMLSSSRKRLMVNIQMGTREFQSSRAKRAAGG